MLGAIATTLDAVLVLAGHGDSITGYSTQTSGSPAEDEAGIGIVPIAAVVLLGITVVALMVWLNRQEADESGTRSERSLSARSVAPAGLLVAVIAAPLVIWTASSGGEDAALSVERYVNDKTNEPELLISLREEGLNELSTTDGKRTVRIECTGRDGSSVLTAIQKWPFIVERGYEDPHAHQPASKEQTRLADRCRLRGTEQTLEADVEGALIG